MELVREEPSAGRWRVERIADVVNAFAERARMGAGRPLILVIDGRSSSGKTTLAGRVVDTVSATAVVHTDDIAWSHSRFGWADRGCEFAVDLAGDVTLEDAADLSGGLSFGLSSFGASFGVGVAAEPGASHDVDGPVQLPVAVPGESMPAGNTARGWDWCCAGEGGEGSAPSTLGERPNCR